MALARKLFVNWHTRRRLLSDLSSNPDPVATMGFLKFEQYPFEVVIVEPDTTNPLRFTRVDITGLSLKMAINDTLEDATPLAEQTSWTQDTGRSVFSGTLNLNTAAMNSYITTDKSPYFELEITDGTNRVKILQEVCAVSLSLIPVTTVSPDPTREYPTMAEVRGVCVERAGAAGETFFVTSPNGSYRRIIGCNDDGTTMDDIEAL